MNPRLSSPSPATMVPCPVLLELPYAFVSEKSREKGGKSFNVYRKRGMHKGNGPPRAILYKGPGSTLSQFMLNCGEKSE